MMEWFKWFGRWSERDGAQRRLQQLKETYGGHGERVIRLSARTDLARKAAGSTQRAFEFVERTFAAATAEYARVNEVLDGLEAGLQAGKIGDFAAAEKAVKGIGPKLDELEQHLVNWEARWSQVPQQVEEMGRALAALRVQVEQAVAAVGAPLRLSDRLAAMAQHLERTRQVLAQGNPVEAGHLSEDLRLALEKVSQDVSAYVSGASAITSAEADVADLRERVAAAGGREAAAEALLEAEALIPRLRPALAAGKLEQFQSDLLQLQRNLSAGRAALKG